MWTSLSSKNFKILTVAREYTYFSWFLFEESRFRRHIVIHRAMEIEMILRYIGQRDDIVFDSEIAEIINPMTRGLENEMCDAHLFCFSDMFPELKWTIHGHL